MRSSELFGSVRSEKQLERILDQLVEAWCEERQLDGLRICFLCGPCSLGRPQTGEGEHQD